MLRLLCLRNVLLDGFTTNPRNGRGVIIHYKIEHMKERRWKSNWKINICLKIVYVDYGYLYANFQKNRKEIFSNTYKSIKYIQIKDTLITCN